MSEAVQIANLRDFPPINNIIKRLFLSDTTLNNEEKQFLLSIAILLFEQYQKDNSYKTALEFAYFIILKYSILFQDWGPLYDLSVNMGFYPVSDVIIKNAPNFDKSILNETISAATATLFSHNGILETKEQNKSRIGILGSSESYISYIAPTSFGKSQIIIEHIRQNLRNFNRFAVIVPTKSLLMQTYKNIKKAFPNIRVLIHDEMYDNDDERFIVVFTQERALRLLERHTDVSFDILYIDEAHRLLENTDRSVLLSRLIKLSKIRNIDIKILYLSPLIRDSKNISLGNQHIREYKISFNIKEPMIYEYSNDGEVFIYNRFFNQFYPINRHADNYLQYITTCATEKNFIYLYSPIKIEKFAKQLFMNTHNTDVGDEISQIIDTLNKYVHEEFYVSKYLNRGIIYIHGKIPDDIKDYLEYKFNKTPQIKYLIANNVILEGINLPFDTLFIVDSYGLSKNSIINLIGRVNRLNMVFTDSIDNLSKLLPTIHFVENNEEFCSCSMQNKIELLKTSDFKDEVDNPLLDTFDISKFNEATEDGQKQKQKCEQIIQNETIVFDCVNNNVQILKQNMLKLSMNTIYDMNDELCSIIMRKIENYKENNGVLSETEYIFQVLNNIFLSDVSNNIKDKEFSRLVNAKTQDYYYNLMTKYRKKSLKEQISLMARYISVNKVHNPYLWIGTQGYGECNEYGCYTKNQNFYINLTTKTFADIVNISIIKIKLEEDFISFKLNKFFQLMLDYEIISEDVYNYLVYGTNDRLILSLSKLGLSLNIINKLIADNQLENLSINNIGNLTYNEQFSEYKNASDDFFKFELDKFLP